MDAHKDFLNCFKEIDLTVKAVVHCFNEDKKFYEYLDKGFWIGFTDGFVIPQEEGI